MDTLEEQIQIEFFGLPGAGKTTISRELHLLLLPHDRHAVYSPHATWDHAPGPIRTAARAVLIARALRWRRSDWLALSAMASKQRSYRDKAKSVFNFLTVSSFYRQISGASRITIVDQGLLQAIWSAHLRGAHPIAIDEFSEMLMHDSGLARIYVCVEAPVSTCVERLANRKERHSRMQANDLLQDGALWRHAELVRESVIDGLRSVCDRRGVQPRLLLVDGTRDPAEVAACIAAQVLSPSAHSERPGEGGKESPPPS